MTSSKYKINESVIIRNFARGQRWIKVNIFKTLGNLLYLLKDENNRTYKRHQNQIRSCSHSSITQDFSCQNQENSFDGIFDETQGLLASTKSSSILAGFNQPPPSTSHICPQPILADSNQPQPSTSQVCNRRSDRKRRPPNKYSPPPFLKLVRRD